MLGAGALIVVGIAWIVVTGLLARRQLDALVDRMNQVRVLVAQGHVAQAEQAAKDIPAMAARARGLTSGPAWWTVAHIPYLGRPAEVVRGTTEATDQVCGKAVPELLSVAALVDPTSLRRNGNTIVIDRLTQAEPQLAAASATLDRVSAELAGLPRRSWLSAVDGGRAAMQAQIAGVTGYVDAAARAAVVLPRMLGDGTTKRYFIGLQNEAELRGTGGLPGAFAIARVRDGTITFERFLPDTALFPNTPDHAIATGLDFGTSYDELYGSFLPTTTYVNSNVSPDFTYTARIWAAMWQKTSGEHIDGVLAVDPTALSEFLTATGPVAAGGIQVNAGNVVSLTQKDVYALYPDNERRKQFLVSVLKAVATKLTSGAGNAYDIVHAAAASSAQQRLLVWTSDPTAQALLQQTDYGGAIPQDDRPFSAVVLNNAAGGKLDYYLTRSVDYARTGCGSRRDVMVTITLRNNAPAAGLPSYVTTRGDVPPAGAKPGDTKVLLDYYASADAKLERVTVDDATSGASFHATQGHTVLRMSVEVPRGRTVTIELHLDEPAGSGTPRIWHQPGVTPIAVTAFDQHC